MLITKMNLDSSKIKQFVIDLQNKIA